jgi:hypothetical protein
MNSFKFKGATGTCTASGARTVPLRRFKDSRGFEAFIGVDNTVEPTILIGCERLEIKRLTVERGFEPVYIEPPYTANTQVSLDRQMAADVIKALQAFVDVVEQTPTFDDLERTTIIIDQPEASKPALATLTNDRPEPISPTESDEPESIPALEMAKAINDTQQIIDRLTSNRLQKAFVYLLGTLSGICIGSWTAPELLTRAVAKFGLSREEALRLGRMYRTSIASGTQR